jgi:hypothetical protein
MLIDLLYFKIPNDVHHVIENLHFIIGKFLIKLLFFPSIFERKLMGFSNNKYNKGNFSVVPANVENHIPSKAVAV